MAAIQFTDFDLLIESQGDSFRARLLDSPAGQAELSFSAPFTDQDLEIFFLRVSRPRRGVRRIDSDEMQLAKQYGTRLFQAIFKDEILGCFRSSLTLSQQAGKGLRIRLRLDAPALSNLPWEFLFDPSHKRFLTTSIETPVVRYFDLPQPVRPLTISPPLNIAVMISNPTDYPRLDVTHEWQQLMDALNPMIATGVINLERIEPPNLEALQRRLRRKDYHIFHFIGHGSFDPHTQDGVLLFENEQGRGVPMSGQYVGALLRDHKPLRLVILNSCEGARTSPVDPFAGIAQGLIQQGLPAVIGMQFEITDQAAIDFSQEFYSALVDGYPVDAALAEARKAIFARGNDTEWGTPVLFTRAPDGYIFQIEILNAPPPQPIKSSSEPPNESPQTTALPTESPKETPQPVSANLEAKYIQGLKAYVQKDWQKACFYFEQVAAERPSYEDVTEKLYLARKHLSPAEESQPIAPPSQPKPAQKPAVYTRLPATLCVETLGGVADPILWQDEVLPATATKVFSTSSDNQSEVDIIMTFGGNRFTKDNLPLGKFNLAGIPPAKQGDPRIEVMFNVDEKLQLNAVARDKARGYERRSQTIDLSQLTPPIIISPLPDRETYQRFGNVQPSDFDWNKISKGGEFSDFFEQLFGGGKGTRLTHDLQFELELTLVEAVLGCQKIIQYNRREICKHCNGSGAEPPSKPEVCRDCNGSGKSNFDKQTGTGTYREQSSCQSCAGKGTIILKPCKKCQKSGFQEIEHNKLVTIPAGVNTGTKVRLAGEGNIRQPQEVKGDLYLNITVKEDPMYIRRGQDLFLDYPIEQSQTRKASMIMVPLIEGGKGKIKLPALVSSGTEFVIPGKGAWNLKTKGRGDLRVVVQVYDPRKQNPGQLEQRQRISEALKR
jgi:DnaJ-class molecular chaperone